jgi:hypothetical protein
VRSSVEWLLGTSECSVGVLRVHPDGGYGSPYSWACTLVLDGRIASLHGVTRAPTMGEARAIKEAMIYVGASTSEWERKGEATRLVRHRKGHA